LFRFTAVGDDALLITLEPAAKRASASFCRSTSARFNPVSSLTALRPEAYSSRESPRRVEPTRDQILRKAARRGNAQAVFLNHLGARLTAAVGGAHCQKICALINVNWDLHPPLAAARFSPHTCLPTVPTCAQFRSC